VSEGAVSIAASASERGAEARRERTIGPTVTALRAVHVIVPDDIDDPARCSGGNAYDRRLCAGLAADGCAVHEWPVAGEWPQPGPAARSALAARLAALPDGAVVLVDGLVACGVPEVVVPAARRLAVVVLVHLPLGDETGADPALVDRERATLAAAAGVVATSPWTARRLAAVHGLDPDRITVAVPGVDPAPRASGTDGGTRLLCVGSITPTKGQDLLVDALAAVADLPWTCDLVGPVRRDPGHLAAVRAAITRHGLDARVRVTGPKTGGDLDAAYATADLLVVPSRAETYGMVVTEALARGVPVLASAAGGLVETLGHDPDGRVPGMIVPVDDVAALGAALRSWLQDPVLRNGLRDRARTRQGMLHGWEVTSRCVAKILDQHDLLERLSGTRG
jgi:glycosyltransferase involved in cell wall biosynthesis